ncbi:hypothetical protein [Bradyrhizobium lablabi]|uniref:hypothetical protein n=1 Tax=Bradyrhizobium lablabi TaxID=722472 RepID=UPI001BA73620|nr:hypothetical protein [Bradyrhizobium lablabi]MBR0696209.1 hypothetical protein [Bradyrhizobium lablabi]
MAEEAFALSPISARAAQPSEEDYVAISDAFMETARGRWFLGEYAKRNRNADTRMVLDAVARIEESLGAQRQAAMEAILDERLEDALGGLRGAIEAAQASAVAALDDLGFEQKLAPVRKGVRVLREISWRLREIGNDGRICDIIDSQMNAVEASAAEVSLDEAKAVLDAAFAGLARRLSEFGENEAPAPSADTAVAGAASPSPAPMTESTAIDIAAVEAPPPAREAVIEPIRAPAAEAAAPMPTQPIDAALAEAEAALAEAEAAELARVAEEAAADAHDEAMLDLIAMEMGAPDPTDYDDAEMIVDEAHLVAAPPFESGIAAQASEAEPARVPEPVVAPPAARVEAAIAESKANDAVPQAGVAPAREPAMEVSLGSTIIASGIVKKPTIAANDPLASIRRMSQAEKIAFFS